MTRPPAYFPPPRMSGAIQQRVAYLRSQLPLSRGTAEVAIGIVYELTKKELAVWLGKSVYAIDALQRRVHSQLGVHSRAGVAARVAASLGSIRSE